MRDSDSLSAMTEKSLWSYSCLKENLDGKLSILKNKKS